MNIENHRLYPVSDDGDVLRGGERVKIYQDFGYGKHYLCQDQESWTRNPRQAGVWVVSPDYNWFDKPEDFDAKIQLIEKPVASSNFDQLDLFTGATT